MKYKRSERVGELIREEIANIIAREIKDPRIGFVTITQVDISNDLRNMTVYCSVMGDNAEKQKNIKGLTNSSGFIRKLLGRRLYLKRVPELEFKLDRSIEFSDKISKIIREINEGEEKAVNNTELIE